MNLIKFEGKFEFLRVNLIKGQGFAGKFKILRVKYDLRGNLAKFEGKPN